MPRPALPNLFEHPRTTKTGPEYAQHAQDCLEVSARIRDLYRQVYLTCSAIPGRPGSKKEKAYSKIMNLYAEGHRVGYDQAFQQARVGYEQAKVLYELFACFDWVEDNGKHPNYFGPVSPLKVQMSVQQMQYIQQLQNQARLEAMQAAQQQPPRKR